MIAQRPNSSYPFPQIDREQAQRQLQYLNHFDVAEAKPRLFYHSDDLRKHNDKGRKLDRLNWKELENYQKDGRGVYVVVNGAGGGGHEDKDIVQCSAIFCEWDDRPVEDQLMHWETIGFLEPTFTVYSGDKSAQPYWVWLCCKNDLRTDDPPQSLLLIQQCQKVETRILLVPKYCLFQRLELVLYESCASPQTLLKFVAPY